jgi:hypothetical protein
MGSRIEAVEVLSYRLELPRLALERLPAELGSSPRIRIERDDDGSILIEHDGQDSFLRFQLDGDAAELVEISIGQDPQGAFFQKVLGALMVRFHGDLRVRLVFDPQERGNEPWAEVSIERGRTSWPGLATQSAAVRLAHAAAEGGSVGASGEGGEPAEEPLTAEEEELSRLLTRADTAWQEYQRLKRQRQQQKP